MTSHHRVVLVVNGSFLDKMETTGKTGRLSRILRRETYESSISQKLLDPCADNVAFGSAPNGHCP